MIQNKLNFKSIDVYKYTLNMSDKYNVNMSDKYTKNFGKYLIFIFDYLTKISVLMKFVTQ